MILILFIFVSCICFGQKNNIQNIDKQTAVYNFESVKIGNQVWMRKNLSVEHYKNGDPIRHITDSTAWVNLSTGAWRYYNDDPATGAIYGKLYNWYAVHDPRGLAPAGWHVATDDEWSLMVTALGSDFNAGKMLKEIGTSHWLTPNTSATNESGFTALPGGSLRYGDSYFTGLGASGCWWTASGSAEPYAKMRSMSHSGTSVYRGSTFRTYGFSVRCVKD